MLMCCRRASHGRRGWVAPFCSGLGGGVLGAIISVVVNNALIEISITPFFAAVFGGVLLLLGCLMLWRKLTEASHGAPLTRVLMLAFSSLVFVSGASCFVLEKDWCHSLSPRAKVPLYVALAVSLSFAVAFSLVDLLNLYSDCSMLTRSGGAPLVSTPSQILLVLGGAVLMGSTFGYLFGVMDVEDDDVFHNKLRNEERASLPIGFAIGGLVGLLNPLLVGSPFEEYVSLRHGIDDSMDDDGGDSDGDWGPPRKLQFAS
jgi:hypothetical protein